MKTTIHVTDFPSNSRFFSEKMNNLVCQIFRQCISKRTDSVGSFHIFNFQSSISGFASHIRRKSDGIRTDSVFFPEFVSHFNRQSFERRFCNTHIDVRKKRNFLRCDITQRNNRRTSLQNAIGQQCVTQTKSAKMPKHSSYH